MLPEFRLLTKVRNWTPQVGQKYEAEDSDFGLEKMTGLWRLTNLVVRHQICSYCSTLLKSAITAILALALQVYFNY